MKIQEEPRGAHVVIRIIGTLALGENTRLLQERFEAVATEKSGALILDMSGLEHLDSTAVGVLVGGLKRLESQGRRFYLVSPRERVALGLPDYASGLGVSDLRLRRGGDQVGRPRHGGADQ